MLGKSKVIDTLFAIGVVSIGPIILALNGINLFGPTEKSVPSYSESERKEQAVQACQEDVTAELKAPSTAHFVGFYAEHFTDYDFDNRHWHVTGYVDAQNSFGAMLRKHITCEVKQDYTNPRGSFVMNENIWQ
jgi:hypothetical protein